MDEDWQKWTFTTMSYVDPRLMERDYVRSVFELPPRAETRPESWKCRYCDCRQPGDRYTCLQCGGPRP